MNLIIDGIEESNREIRDDLLRKIREVLKLLGCRNPELTCLGNFHRLSYAKKRETKACDSQVFIWPGQISSLAGQETSWKYKIFLEGRFLPRHSCYPKVTTPNSEEGKEHWKYMYDQHGKDFIRIETVWCRESRPITR